LVAKVLRDSGFKNGFSCKPVDEGEFDVRQINVRWNNLEVRNLGFVNGFRKRFVVLAKDVGDGSLEFQWV